MADRDLEPALPHHLSILCYPGLSDGMLLRAALVLEDGVNGDGMR